jgi:N,N-dimethylformamidase
VAFLAPTASYLAYAANTFAAQEGAELAGGGAGTGFIDATYCFLHSNPHYGFSCYDLHADGSGVAYMSQLRPQFLMHRGDLAGQFEDDSRLVSFLRHHEISHDVLTDMHLHRDGVACLAPYRCVITGTHPEYYSSKMLAGVREFTASGGRLLYLGANGFYWHVAFDEEEEEGSGGGRCCCCQRMEVRRAEGGMRSWVAAEGEYYCSYNAELGGLWRRKGVPPQAVAGVGFTAQGFDSCTDYRVEPDSQDPRARFIFDGVAVAAEAEAEAGAGAGADTVLSSEVGARGIQVGDRFGAGGHRGGAAGLEIDRADTTLGTPRHALRVACADTFPHSYKRVGEEAAHAHSAITGLMDPLIRADVVFYEAGTRGGAVFSTGSIAWASNLVDNDNGYESAVARITRNVIERFASEEPFGPPATSASLAPRL